MLGLMRLSLVRRFLQTARTDGIGPALRKAGGFIAARLRHVATDSVPVAAGQGAAGYLTPVWGMLAEQGAFHVSTAPALRYSHRKLAIIGDLNLPQCRKYRVEQLAEFWRHQGVDVDFSHYQDLPRATTILQDATHLVCYRLRACPPVSTCLYEARRLALPILYDIDDPLFSVPAYAAYGNMAMLGAGLRGHFMAEAPAYLDVMNGCDVVSVSTPGLMQHAAQLTARPVYLRRNFADPATLIAGEDAMRQGARDDGLFRVAFASGSQGHEADFSEIVGPISAFLAANRNRRLMVLGYFDHTRLPPAVAQQTEIHGFSDYATYLQTLAKADCAIMPLADDLFNRCKSAVRAIDAAAVGLPAICSAVGDFPNLVEDRETGRIAHDPDDWGRALTELAETPERARAMGLRARQRLETHWCAQPAPHIIDPALSDWVLG